MALRHIKEIYSTLSELHFGHRVMTVKVGERLFDVTEVDGEAPSKYLDDRDGKEYNVEGGGFVRDFPEGELPVFLDGNSKPVDIAQSIDVLKLKNRQLAICINNFTTKEVEQDDPENPGEKIKVIVPNKYVIKNREVTILFRDENGGYHSSSTASLNGYITEDILNAELEKYYTKTDADGKFFLKSLISNYYTKTDADGKFFLKSSINSYYSKTEVDTNFVKQNHTGDVTVTKGDIKAVEGDNGGTLVGGTIEGKSLVATKQTIPDSATGASSSLLRSLGIDVITKVKGTAINGKYTITISSKNSTHVNLKLDISDPLFTANDDIEIKKDLTDSDLSADLQGKISISGRIRDNISADIIAVLDNGSDGGDKDYVISTNSDLGIQVLKKEFEQETILQKTIIKPGAVDVTSVNADGSNTGVVKAKTLFLDGVPFTSDSFAVQGESSTFQNISTGHLAVSDVHGSDGNATIGGTLNVTGMTTVGNLTINGTTVFTDLEVNSILKKKDENNNIALNFDGANQKLTINKTVANIVNPIAEFDYHHNTTNIPYHKESTLTFKNSDVNFTNWKVGHFKDDAITLTAPSDGTKNDTSFEIEAIYGNGTPKTVAQFYPNDIFFNNDVTIAGVETDDVPLNLTTNGVLIECITDDKTIEKDGADVPNRTKWSLESEQGTEFDLVKRKAISIAEKVSDLAVELDKVITESNNGAYSFNITGNGANPAKSGADWAALCISIAGTKKTDAHTAQYDNPLVITEGDKIDDLNDATGALYDVYSANVEGVADDAHKSGTLSLYGAIDEVLNATTLIKAIIDQLVQENIDLKAGYSPISILLLQTMLKKAELYKDKIGNDSSELISEIISIPESLTNIATANVLNLTHDDVTVATFSRSQATSGTLSTEDPGKIPLLGKLTVEEIETKTINVVSLDTENLEVVKLNAGIVNTEHIAATNIAINQELTFKDKANTTESCSIYVESGVVKFKDASGTPHDLFIPTP